MPNTVVVINVGKSRLIPFVVRNNLGNVDLTADVTVRSNSTSQVIVSVSSSDKRVLLVSGLASTTDSPHVTITSPFGDTLVFDVSVPTPPDTSSIELGEPGPEFDSV